MSEVADYGSMILDTLDQSATCDSLGNVKVGEVLGIE